MGRFLSLQIVFFIFIFGDAKLFSSNNSTRSYVCDDGARETLLKFKESVHDPNDTLSSWQNTTDCCKWKGIGCDTKSGRVLKLHLRSYEDPNYTRFYLRNMSSCLVDLKYLEYLDLSGNKFSKDVGDYNYSNIPEFLGLIESLTYLNLSMTGIGSFVPQKLGNLTNLEVLDLREMDTRDPIPVDNLRWMSRMSSLKYLDMSVMYLDAVSNLWQDLSVLPSLSVVGLYDCHLNDTHFSPTHINSTFLSSIQQLNIGGNEFSGSFPSLLKNMTSLRVLRISEKYGNTFVNATSIPAWLGNLKGLEHIDLSVNNFVTVEGGLSRMLQSLCHLKSLSLHDNNFQDVSFETDKDVPSVCVNGYALETLNMANSGLKGYLPDWLGQFNKLTELDLSNNMLHGHIPASIRNLLALEVLRLSNNKLNGYVPESIGQFSALKSLDLSSNLLQGEISEIHLSNHLMLKELKLGSNQLSINIRPNWVPPFQLTYLDMRSCKIIGTVFPQWLQSQNKLERLLLSNATISGPLPNWFKGLRLLELDLSHNQITGPIPQNISVAFPTLNFVRLSYNMFNGTIPSSFCKMETLNTLDLSDNALFGDIPNCWNSTYLQVIRLSSNKLIGNIPSSFGNLPCLLLLHLNNNNLKGELPRSWNGRLMIVLDVGDNNLSGNVPKWIGTDMPLLHILRLRKNMFDGCVPHQLCHLEYLQILDLASNNLNGTIPPCLGNLTGMIHKPSKEGYMYYEEKIEVVMKAVIMEYEKTVLDLAVNLDISSNKLVGTIPNELSHLIELLSLNLSYNHLTGCIPNSIGDMKSLISLDLSNNQLYGKIPTSMSDLTSLSHLNLSENNLSGKIPSGRQLQTLEDPSIYMGNPKLCGDPLPKRCPGDEPFNTHVPSSSHEENTEEDDKSDELWFYMAITLGYATGLWVVIGTLVLKKRWRYAYFRFADETINRIYVIILINYARFKKKMLWGKGSS